MAMFVKSMGICSFVWLIAIVVLWADSYQPRTGPSRFVCVEGRFGSLEYAVVCMPGALEVFKFEQPPGCCVRNFVNKFEIHFWQLTSGFASCSFLCFMPPLYKRRRRRKRGMCVKCGYDLRGSSDRCPECGQEFHTIMSSDRILM